LPRVLIEVCVDDAAGLAAAVQGGADRIELCAGLPLGGLTPSAGFMQMASGCGLPVFAIIRPRAGDFVYDARDLAIMQADIAMARQAGLAGVVLGANHPDGRLDEGALRILSETAHGMGLTLHRAFDLVPDVAAAIETAIHLGFHRILTSGQATTATAGLPTLGRCFALAAGRISIMPGAGVSAATIPALKSLPLREVHGSCSTAHRQAGPVVDLGFAATAMRHTDADQIRALRAALDAH
jgi:copper homeostasis protein